MYSFASALRNAALARRPLVYHPHSGQGVHSLHTKPSTNPAMAPKRAHTAATASASSSSSPADQHLSTAEVYDPASDSGAQVTSLTSARSSFVAAAL